MQLTLFPEPKFEEVRELKADERLSLEELASDYKETLLVDNLFPKNTNKYDSILFYLRCESIDTNFYKIKFNEELIGFASVLRGWNSYENEPASPSTIFVIVKREYQLYCNEIRREIERIKESLRGIDESGF